MFVNKTQVLHVLIRKHKKKMIFKFVVDAIMDVFRCFSRNGELQPIFNL